MYISASTSTDVHVCMEILDIACYLTSWQNQLSIIVVLQGWGNHPGNTGHDLIKILTFDTGLAKL